MKKGLAVLENSVSEMTALLTVGDDLPIGFSIVPATIPNVEFNPFTTDAMEIAGFTPTPSNRIPDGFFLLEQPYVEYLEALRLAQAEHPANIDGKPWAGESKFVFKMPSREEAVNAQTN